MNDVMFIFERLETARCGKSDLTKNVLGYTIAIQLVHGATVHELHTDVDSSFLEEGTVEVDDKGRSATVQDVEFHDDGSEL